MVNAVGDARMRASGVVSARATVDHRDVPVAMVSRGRRDDPAVMGSVVRHVAVVRVTDVLNFIFLILLILIQSYRRGEGELRRLS